MERPKKRVKASSQLHLEVESALTQLSSCIQHVKASLQQPTLQGGVTEGNGNSVSAEDVQWIRNELNLIIKELNGIEDVPQSASVNGTHQEDAHMQDRQVELRNSALGIAATMSKKLRPASTISLASTCSELLTLLAPAVSYIGYITRGISFNHSNISKYDFSAPILVNEKFNYYTPTSFFNDNFGPFPANIKKLNLYDGLDSPIESALPDTILDITFGENFNQPVDEKLPRFLTHVVFGRSFNQPLYQLPATVTHITLGDSFNNPLTIPPALTHLTFGYEFDQPITSLPETLAFLQFGDTFNQPLCTLPNKLLTLKVGNQFNQNLNPLPASLIELFLGFAFNQPLGLPNSLECLSIGAIGVEGEGGSQFDKPLLLPPSLFQLALHANYTHPLIIPTALKRLALSSTVAPNLQLCKPSSLERMSIHSEESPDLFVNVLKALPSTITVLHMVMNLQDFNDPLLHLPPSLTNLYVSGDAISAPLDKLPTKLTHLALLADFDFPIDSLPPTVTYLQIGDTFNQLVDRLPSQLRSLKFGSDFNQPVDNLPTSLTSLTFGDSFNQPVEKLPATLTHLTFGNSFNQTIFNLPSNITHLYIGEQYKKPAYCMPSNLVFLSFLSHHSYTFTHLPPKLIKLRLAIGTETRCYFPPNLRKLDIVDVDQQYFRINLPHRMADSYTTLINET